MWMNCKLAWRNIFRNKRRTFLSGAAIGIGLASLIFSDALVLGMKESMIANLTSSFMGEGQIHRSGFRETLDAELTIRNLGAVVDSLQQDPRVARFSVRTLVTGMVSSASNFRAIMVVGIVPSDERDLSQVDDAIIKGDYFRQEQATEIVIGARLADELEASLGSRLVVTMAQPGTGDLSQQLFLVSGIFRLDSRDMDAGMVFIRLPEARRMLGFGSEAHEIAIKFAAPGIAGDPANTFWKDYSGGGNEALGWTKLAPQLDAIFRLTGIMMFVMALILFGVVAFGIVNTLFMSIYERVFEFGVLRAIGTRPRRLGELIVFESGALAAVSICMGLLLAGLLLWIFARVGIDYRGIEFEGVTIRHLIYPVATLRQFVVYPLWALLFTLLTGTYPAVHVARLKPAEAMRRSL
jgi:ABC-type lipoprotein release transport system permease subunit